MLRAMSSPYGDDFRDPTTATNGASTIADSRALVVAVSVPPRTNRHSGGSSRSRS